MVAHLLLRVQKKNPLEDRKIITYLTTIIPLTDAEEKEWINEKYENVKATKHIICVFAHAHVTYVFLKYLGNLMSLSKSYSSFYFLNCIQEFI